MACELPVVEAGAHLPNARVGKRVKCVYFGNGEQRYCSNRTTISILFLFLFQSSSVATAKLRIKAIVAAEKSPLKWLSLTFEFLFWKPQYPWPEKQLEVVFFFKWTIE